MSVNSDKGANSTENIGAEIPPEVLNLDLTLNKLSSSLAVNPRKTVVEFNRYEGTPGRLNRPASLSSGTVAAREGQSSLPSIAGVLSQGSISAVGSHASQPSHAAIASQSSVAALAANPVGSSSGTVASVAAVNSVAGYLHGRIIDTPTATNGVSVFGRYVFDSATGDADPGSGELRLNNATQSAATFMFVSKTSDGGVDVSAFLATLANGDRIYLQDKEDADSFVLAKVTGAVTDATGYVKVPITVESNGTDLLDTKALLTGVSIAAGGGGGPTILAEGSTSISSDVDTIVATFTATPGKRLFFGMMLTDDVVFHWHEGDTTNSPQTDHARIMVKKTAVANQSTLNIRQKDGGSASRPFDWMVEEK